MPPPAAVPPCCCRGGHRRTVVGQVLDGGDDPRQRPPIPVHPNKRRDLGDLASDMGGVITAHLEHSFHRRGVDELLEAVRQAVCHRSRLRIDVDEPVVEGPGTAPRRLHGDSADFLQHFAFHVHRLLVPTLDGVVGDEQVGDR